MVRLSKLVESLGGERRGADPDLLDVHIDSRRVGAGELFCALQGGSVDGADFAPAAIARGAAAVLAPRALDLDATQWVHPDARRVAGEAAALVHGSPSRAQSTVAVTGTNGKTTVVHLLWQILTAAGVPTGRIGTVEVALFGGTSEEATHTTPDATELARLAARNLAAGGKALVLEASSHALAQERLAGMELDVAVFTNLGHDHLDYHLDLERYAAAKERIFRYLKPGGAAVIHAGDERAERFRRAALEHTDRVVTYGVGSNGDLRAAIDRVDAQGTHLFLTGMGILKTGLFLPLVGRHNVENALAALASALLLGANPSQLLEGFASIFPPTGRLEEVRFERAPAFRVFVDFAHTPDALRAALEALRATVDAEGAGGRVLCVFGCGGDRDRAKRAPMGEVAAELADVVVLTSDNPRSEDPLAILEEIRRGIREGDPVMEQDRRRAIRTALGLARPGDVVLIAGKGHERWQYSKGRRFEFRDDLVAREELP